MALYKAKGIVLGSIPFEESGKLVYFFSREYGKIKLIAKGSRKPGSRFGGRLEPFTYSEVLAAKGRDLDILSQIELIEPFQKVREHPDLMHLGIYFIRVVSAATEFGQKNPELLKLLLLSLNKLKEQEDGAKVERFFDLNFLKIEGIYRAQALPKMLISEHLNKDITSWMIPSLN